VKLISNVSISASGSQAVDQPPVVSAAKKSYTEILGQLSSLVSELSKEHSQVVRAEEDRLEKASRALRNIVATRQLRDRFLPADIFADPAWDILLDLTIARIDGKQIAVSSLCIAANVPTTTALRWIKNLITLGLLVRRPDTEDYRRSYVEISEPTFLKMLAFGEAADRSVD